MSVEKRLSRVDYVQVDRMNDAAVLHLGDNERTELHHRTIALQRMIPNFLGDETRYAAYPLFFRPLLQLHAGPEGLFESRSPCAEISVGTIKAKAIAASGLLRIGSGESVTAISRIKHIRQFNGAVAGTAAENFG